MVFALAEILGLEKLGQGDHFRALPRGFTDVVDGALHVLSGVWRAGHLDDSDGEIAFGQVRLHDDEVQGKDSTLTEGSGAAMPMLHGCEIAWWSGGAGVDSHGEKTVASRFRVRPLPALAEPQILTPSHS